MSEDRIATLEARIGALEEHLAHQAQAIEQLDEVVREQWRTIEGLRREIARLEGRVDRAEAGEPNDRPPPHY